MIRCNSCGTNNLDGSEYCDECGMKLDLSANSAWRSQDRNPPPVFQPPSAVPNEVMNNTSEGPLVPPSFTTSTSIPKPALPVRPPRQQDGVEGRNYTNPPQVKAVEIPRPEPVAPPEPQQSQVASDQSISARQAAKLVIQRGGRVGKEFVITGIETNIGRWDADSGIFPDIDLDEDDPEAKISRRHARIVNHNGQFFIEDLGSTNGTFINRGRRLLPGKRHMLQSGDEVIVGKTFLKFQISR